MPVPSHMRKAAAANDIFQLIITTKAITGKVSGKILQKLFCMIAAPAGLVIIQPNWRQLIISGAIQPHIRLGLCRFPCLLQYLAWCFICMDNVSFQQMPVKLFIHRLHIIYAAFDNPVCQRQAVFSLLPAGKEGYCSHIFDTSHKQLWMGMQGCASVRGLVFRPRR